MAKPQIVCMYLGKITFNRSLLSGEDKTQRFLTMLITMYAIVNMHILISITTTSISHVHTHTYGIGGKSCNRTPAAPESWAESDGSQAASSGNLCTYAVDEKSCNRALHADRRGVRRRDARGAQRLRKAIRGGGRGSVATRRWSRTTRSGYGMVGSTTSQIIQVLQTVWKEK